MRVGSIVYATDQGLGYLAKSFYDAGVVTDVVQVLHGSRENHHDWYPDSTLKVHPRQLMGAALREFISSMDVMLFFETPFCWDLLQFCKDHKVRTALMPMYECMPKTHPMPDLILCPSKLDLEYYPDTKRQRSVFIPVPVENSVAARWRQRTEAKVFVHNAGHGGLKGRNGMAEVLEALKYVKSEGVKLILRSQGPNTIKTNSDGHVRVGNVLLYASEGSVERKWLYDAGDVFLFPEKFNGLSLPLQEAYASGMLVMVGNRFPMNDWLPKAPLIPVKEYRRNSISGRCLEFDEAMYDPRAIAAKIDEWYGRDITEYSDLGRRWALLNSWEFLKPLYLQALETL